MHAIVTLLTDFGYSDAFVGVMKGVLLARRPGLTIVDLAHGLDPGDRLAAAFQLRAALPYFPAGTVHAVVVDPGVGSARRIVAARLGAADWLGTQTVVAPDNGLLTPLLPDDAEVREVAHPALRLPAVSNTFHGRDVFAPAAAALATGFDPASVGPRVEPVRDALLWPRPVVHDAGVDGEVVHVDRFGNCSTNLEAAQLEAAAGGGLATFGRSGALPLSHTYASVAPGEPVAVVNSAGLLEIAVRDGSAARIYKLERHAPVRWRRAEGGAERGRR